MKILLWLILFSVSTVNAFAAEGPEEGTESHGGDEIALDFQRTLFQAVEKLQADPALREKVRDIDFQRLMTETTILVTNEALTVRRNGFAQESVMVNYPAEKLVRIQRQRWQKMGDPRLKEALALHEALSLLGLETTGAYPISSEYLKFVGHADFAPGRKGSAPKGGHADDFSRVSCSLFWNSSPFREMRVDNSTTWRISWQFGGQTWIFTAGEGSDEKGSFLLADQTAFDSTPFLPSAERNGRYWRKKSYGPNTVLWAGLFQLSLPSSSSREWLSQVQFTSGCQSWLTRIFPETQNLSRLETQEINGPPEQTNTRSCLYGRQEEVNFDWFPAEYRPWLRRFDQAAGRVQAAEKIWGPGPAPELVRETEQAAVIWQEIRLGAGENLISGGEHFRELDQVFPELGRTLHR